MVDAAFNIVRSCRYGQMVFNVNDQYVGRSLDLYGEYSEGEVALFRQVVRPGDIDVDVGANIGTHTVAFARLTGPTGAVVAFEPQRVVFQTLCANLALNSITNVIAQQATLGAEPVHIVVPNIDYGKANNFGGVALGGFARGEKVPVITLDSLALRACRLIKSTSKAWRPRFSPAPTTPSAAAGPCCMSRTIARRRPAPCCAPSTGSAT